MTEDCNNLEKIKSLSRPLAPQPECATDQYICVGTIIIIIYLLNDY